MVGKPITMRFTEDDRAGLRELAERMQRSQADAIRVILREKLEEIRRQDLQMTAKSRDEAAKDLRS